MGFQLEGSRDVAAAARAGKPGLRRGSAFAPEGVQDRNAAAFCNGPGEEFRLVETAVPLLAPVERHGDDGIEMLVNRYGALHISRERPRERFHAGVFVQMDETAERSFVQAKAGCMVEAPEAGAAGGANSFVVKWICVDERRIADGAEIVGIERGGGFQAVAADGNPGPFEKCALADAAIAGKKQRENAMRNPAKEMGSSRSRYRATREGAPPVSRASGRELPAVE